MSNTKITDILENTLDKSKTIKIIQFEHSKVHEGNYFIFQKEIIDLASSGIVYVGLITDGKYIHYQPTTIKTNSAYLRLEFFENAEFTGGTLTSVMNKNRNSLLESTVLLYLSPTVTQEGIKMTGFSIYGVQGNENKRSGGVASTNQEWVLKPDTLYLAKITNVDDVQCNIDIDFEFYEGAGV